jgi:GAF domain-containing protein
MGEPASRFERLLDEMRRRTETLLADLDDAQRLGREIGRELEEVGRQHDLLANLYVQLRRIHGSLVLAEVVAALAETLTNLVGTEDFALFLRDEGERFEPLTAAGAGRALAPFSVGEGELGEVVQAGAVRYGTRPVAIVPLLVDQKCIGVVALVGLLPHKAALGPRDRALLEVLSEHAGVAIEAATVCSASSGVRRLRVSELRALVGSDR